MLLVTAMERSIMCKENSQEKKWRVYYTVCITKVGENEEMCVGACVCVCVFEE